MAKNPITHLPIGAMGPTVTIPVTAGNPSYPRVLATPISGDRALTLNGGTMKIDLWRDTPMNIVDKINNANIGGVVASLDRYGQLVFNGVVLAGGDPLLLQHLGFNQ
jgi:hypothetical protein